MAAEPINFTRDIKPILSNRCFACHGPDRNGQDNELRLDLRDEAILSAITPGEVDESSLIERINSDDADEVMPPPDSSKRPLSKREIDLLTRWVADGAKYDRHWAYVVPKRTAPQDTEQPAIDHFATVAYKRQGVTGAAQADRRTLIRRLSFDLTGLPPSPEDVEQFIADTSEDAYAVLVEKLLASEQYGERMAMYWLDLVRYADTNGIHSDNHRDVDPYRDYVIQAFNDNKPFDRFTIEQIAGDLLPNRTRSELIASGYNRMNMTTREGGSQPKEFRAKYAADRVRNISAVWLASTMMCCECHDHKYDPISTRDFYRMAAFFADIEETAVGVQKPTMLTTDEQQAQLDSLDKQAAELQTILDTPTDEIAAAQLEWEKTVGDDLKDKKIKEILAVPSANRKEAQTAALAKYYRSIAPALDQSRKHSKEARANRDAFRKSIPTSLVSVAIKPREMRVLARGNWLDDSGEVVTAGIPETFGKIDTGDAPVGRIDLANWLVDGENPLVARVLVNRLWKLMFGRGIVSTLDDFGSQGNVPTHAELLDWLAVELVDSGWDIKHMLRLMAQSQLYQQSSFADAELLRRDPKNDLLARQGRFRLDAEMVRDNALVASGLLVQKVGGPSVKPYQPAGYWAHLNFPRRTYKHDSGESQYRRGLYTYWCRTFLHPSLLAFDASSREECAVERARSNTPLQALVLLNDPTYVEAARVLAENTMRGPAQDTAGRVKHMMGQVLQRSPRDRELTLLVDLYDKHLAEGKASTDSVAKILAVGQAPTPTDVDSTELAALTSVARVILNLHETITRY